MASFNKSPSLTVSPDLVLIFLPESERDAHTRFLNYYSLRSSESILLSRIKSPPFGQYGYWGESRNIRALYRK
jgi:hypothetical protein